MLWQRGAVRARGESVYARVLRKVRCHRRRESSKESPPARKRRFPQRLGESLQLSEHFAQRGNVFHRVRVMAVPHYAAAIDHKLQGHAA